MNSSEKSVVLELVNRVPEHATLLDFARELECAAWMHATALPSSGGWLIGQASREELHRVSHERAVRFVERMLWVFSRGNC